MDILAMKEKRGQLWQEAKTFLEEHTDKDGKISAEDAATYDRMEAEIITLGDNIRRFENQAAMELKLSQPTTQPVISPLSKPKSGRASDEYKEAVFQMLRTNFKQVNNIMQEGTNASGGYLVPTEWDNQLTVALQEENVMRKLGASIPTSGDHKINIPVTQPAAYWVDEGAQISDTGVTFTQRTLGAHKVASNIIVTNELLYDNAFNLENFLLEEMTKSLANAEEDAFINGNTNAKPTGVLTAAMADSDVIITTSGTSITSNEIIDLVYALKRPYRKNAAFITNDSTLAQIRKLKDGSQNYLWQPNYQVGEPDRLLGYPVYTSAYFPAATAGNAAIAFGDFNYYKIGDRGARWFKELDQRYADIWSTGFMVVERVDGILTLPEAVRVLKMKA